MGPWSRSGEESVQLRVKRMNGRREVKVSSEARVEWLMSEVAAHLRFRVGMLAVDVDVSMP